MQVRHSLVPFEAAASPEVVTRLAMSNNERSLVCLTSVCANGLLTVLEQASALQECSEGSRRCRSDTVHGHRARRVMIRTRLLAAGRSMSAGTRGSETYADVSPPSCACSQKALQALHTYPQPSGHHCLARRCLVPPPKRAGTIARVPRRRAMTHLCCCCVPVALLSSTLCFVPGRCRTAPRHQRGPNGRRA